MRALLPEQVLKGVPVVLFAATLLARLIPQPKAAAKIEGTADGNA